MNNLDQRLDKAEEIIFSPSFSNTNNFSGDTPYYIFDYCAEGELYVREKIKYMVNKSKNSSFGHEIVVFDLYDIIINILKSKGYLEQCFEFEKTRGFEFITRSIGSLLRLTSPDNLITRHVRDNTPDNGIIFITGIGKCYPILRSHTILNSLHLVIYDRPLVLFYPGKYDGQEFILFGNIKDDNYYRAFRLVD